MKLTLLDLTQNILSALNSDEVNSIGDTTESQQVADIIRTTYFNMIARTNLPEHKQLIQLTASGDITKPVLMYRPANVSKIDWIKYFKDDNNTNVSDNFQYVTILPIQQFSDMVNSFNDTETNVANLIFIEGGNNFNFRYKTDRQPCFCTVVQNYFIIFDSYDSTVDNTLQEEKTLCFGQIVPVFSMVDAFIPDLDDQQFPLLLNEAKSLAFFELKQTQNPKAEQESKRQWSRLQKDKSLVDKPSYFNQLPDFGRGGAYYPVGTHRGW